MIVLEAREGIELRSGFVIPSTATMRTRHVPASPLEPKRESRESFPLKIWSGRRVRTRPQPGKVALYQLSYCRSEKSAL